MHPQHYTLTLFKMLLDKAPLAMPESLRNELVVRYQELASDETSSAEAIEKALYAGGVMIWPYRKAYDDLYRIHGTLKEQHYIREHLSSNLSARYENFLRDGGSLEDYRRGSLMEEFFSAEEKFELGQAELAGHERSSREVDELVKKAKLQEFEELVENYAARRDRMIDKLAALRGLAEQDKKWKNEILERVRAFEAGFAFLEKPFTEEDVNVTLDYYRGVLELTAEPITLPGNTPEVLQHL